MTLFYSNYVFVILLHFKQFLACKLGVDILNVNSFSSDCIKVIKPKSNMNNSFFLYIKDSFDKIVKWAKLKNKFFITLQLLKNEF